MGMFSDIDYSLIVLQLEKAMANGVATLNSSAKVPTNQISLTASDVGAIASTGNGVLTTLNAASGTISASVLPSYVDDVLNFANLAAFPVAGDTGKIYVTEDTNKVYRWSGSVYVEISSSATAGEALKLTNARTISTTGDATYSISFDGSANVSSAITLANTGVTAGTYNALATQVRPFTVNAKGLITGTGAAVDITPPWSAITSKPTTLNGFGITNALPLSGGTLTGALGLPSSVGTFEIKAGTGDGAGFTLYNTTIRSWWGIGFRDYTDNSTVKAFIDCRTGNIGSSGTISATSFSGFGVSQSTSPTTGASVIAGGQGIGGNQHIGGFTSLGGDASHPAVKFMELSGTTAASQGGMALIAHGLNSAKIKAINVLVSNIPSNYVTPGLVSTAGYQFDVAIGVTQILITNIAANSYNILNKPIVVTVFYIA